MTNSAHKYAAICKQHLQTVRNDISAAGAWNKLPQTSRLEGRPVISEMTAAALSNETILKRAVEEWPSIYRTFRETFGDKFQVEDERMAMFDLGLAATALDMRAVWNLFPNDQAKRIATWVEKLLDSKEWGEYALEELRCYSGDFQAEMERAQHPGYLGGLSTRLLHRWLGDGATEFQVKETGELLILLVVLGDLTLSSFAGTWKAIRDQYEMMEEDMPTETDWEVHGLYDVGKHPDESKPDGTTIFRDESGDLKERWIHPRKLMRLVSKFGAEHVGTICRVLVKGPWEGIKEARMQLSDASIKAFADDSGVAYAQCHFAKGKPAYHLTKKRVWANLDRVDAIISDESLTEAQRIDAIKKISEG